jgi:hypothetical protein
MNLGFKVQAPPKPPAPPVVLAAEGQMTCGEKAEPGIYCERPYRHDGGHLSRSHAKYWQASSPEDAS